MVSAGNVANGIGTYYNYKQAIVGASLGLIFIIIGLTLLNREYTQYTPVRAFITKTPDSKYCTVSTITDKNDSQASKRFQYTCTYEVSYSVKGKNYFSTVQLTNGSEYAVNTPVEIEYDPNNPSVVREQTMNPHTLGGILLVLGLATWGGTYWFTKFVATHKSFRKVYGAASLADSIFSKAKV